MSGAEGLLASAPADVPAASAAAGHVAAGYTIGAAMPVAQDQYFAGEPGLIATFDFDYESIIDFQTSLQWAQFLFLPPVWSSCLCCYPCFLKQNVEWKTRAQHVTLTIDGIRYVSEKRKSLCGLPCSDVGKESKTVPYDKITDCDVQEPAGTACCCCVPRVLSTVNVDTASSGKSSEGVTRHELVLTGLKFPNEFKQAVWGMKRGQAPAHATMPLQPLRAEAPVQAEMTAPLLIEIRDELRQMNALLRTKA